MEQIALIMNNMLFRSAADTLPCCNGNWQFQKSLVCDNEKTLFFEVGFHHPANGLWRVKVLVPWILLKMIMKHFKRLWLQFLVQKQIDYDYSLI